MRNVTDSTPLAGEAIPLRAAVAAFLAGREQAGASTHTVAAYRRDLAGILDRLADGNGAGGTVADLTPETLAGAFASWAGDHAPASVRRAWSAWNTFCDDVVVRGWADANPMSAVARPESARRALRALPAADAPRRLVAVASGTDPRSRHAWPERDTALVGVLLGTGVRLGELTELTRGSLQGSPPSRRLEVRDGRGGARSIPLDAGLDAVLGRYLASRERRFPAEDRSDRRAPLFVDHEGSPLARHQAQYLVRRLYERAGLSADAPDGALVRALRHSFATSAVARGVGVAELQELLGHRSAATTRRHVRAASAELDDGEGVDRRGRRLTAQSDLLARKRVDLEQRLHALRGQPLERS
jgi:integrase/recombinase XerC